MFLNNVFKKASDGMTTSEGANNTSSRGSAFSEDGSRLNKDISFLLGMANDTGESRSVQRECSLSKNVFNFK